MAALTPFVIMAQEVVWRLSPLAVVILSLLLIALFIWLDRRKRPVKTKIAAFETAPAATRPETVMVKAPASPVVEPAPAVSLMEPAIPAPVPSIPLVETSQALAMSEPEELAQPEVTRSAEIELPATELPADDLKIIEGIGPKIAAVLNQAGVKTFSQLAQMAPAQISQILLAAGMRLADPHSWPEQAQLAAAGELEKLKDLQSHLKAGRIL